MSHSCRFPALSALDLESTCGISCSSQTPQWEPKWSPSDYRTFPQLIYKLVGIHFGQSIWQTTSHLIPPRAAAANHSASIGCRHSKTYSGISNKQLKPNLLLSRFRVALRLIWLLNRVHSCTMCTWQCQGKWANFSQRTRATNSDVLLQITYIRANWFFFFEFFHFSSAIRRHIQFSLYWSKVLFTISNNNDIMMTLTVDVVCDSGRDNVWQHWRHRPTRARTLMTMMIFIFPPHAINNIEYNNKRVFEDEWRTVAGRHERCDNSLHFENHVLPGCNERRKHVGVIKNQMRYFSVVIRFREQEPFTGLWRVGWSAVDLRCCNEVISQ